MFAHSRQMQYTVRVSDADPALAGLLLEQFGGPEGEFATAMRYFTQALGEADEGHKELLLEIATEELGHLEIVGSLVVMLNRGGRGAAADARAGEADSFCSLQSRFDAIAQTLVGAGGPNPANSLEAPWTAVCLDEVAAISNLRSNIDAESRARLAYAQLIDATDDPDVKDALAFLMIRENEHRKAFEKALLAIEMRLPPAKPREIPKFLNRYVNTPRGDGGKNVHGIGLKIAAGARAHPDGRGAGSAA